MGEPVFESLFEYRRAEAAVENSSLHPRTVKALDQPPEAHLGRRFGRELLPYHHQHQAWESLRQSPPRSVIVSAGTASGKTECFLVPILDDLVRELERNRGLPLTGVRALFLYPLNALINSQKERLQAWTAGFNEGIRFCLYNGNTMEDLPQHMHEASPEQVIDRKRLRENPPPILVTNATMLEYMLLRPADRPIIEESQGLLRWIVLDEAHTYLGSNAAEVSMLLRRVMIAFGVKPEQVRFVATSATIGSQEAQLELRRYLSDLSGVPLDRVDFITGSRVAPPVVDIGHEPWPCPEELEGCQDRQQRERRLIAVPEVRRLRTELLAAPKSLSEVAQTLGAASPEEALKRLDVLSEPVPNGLEQAILPVRGHYFLRSQAGVWACCNPSCDGHNKDENRPEPQTWPFGAISLSRRKNCEFCGALVFEVLMCDGCGEVYLEGWEHEHDRTLLPSGHPRPASSDDDRLDEDNSDDDEEVDGDGHDTDEESGHEGNLEDGTRRLLFAGLPPFVAEGDDGPTEFDFHAITGSLDKVEGKPV
ncbi:MAG: DEAD/DEAH box helicase, partial [Myxococcales bacterium]|nr:DEAD/DEAH box helicase [Myxococcales bacterium]